jgi:hypothetical protein
VFASLWPARCTISGKTVGCAETTEELELQYEGRGAVTLTRVVLRVDKAALVTAPLVGATVTMDDGRSLRVASVGGSSHDVAWTLHCEDATK